MYGNKSGLTSRSKSTTDVFRASSCLHDAPYPPIDGYSTISRTSRNHPPLTQMPKIDEDNNTTTLKRARSYLTEDLRQQFEQEFESTTVPSPRSGSFVKRLVATLERRNRDNITNDINNGFYKKGFDLRSRNTVPTCNNDGHFDTQYNPEEEFLRQLQFSKSENLGYLRQIPEQDNDDYHSDPENYWDENYNNNNNECKKAKTDETKRNKSGTRRTLKSMLSSLMNWRGIKPLPKGSRDYYATRESLGEEMRAFRQDTMPRLMERATIKGRTDTDRSRDMKREFSNFIGTPNTITIDQPVPIATIHPVYGKHTKPRLIKQHKEIEPESIYANRKVLPPPKAKDSSPPTEHLLRPSKLKSIEKRFSREIEVVQLRKRPASVIYDVPRSNQPVIKVSNGQFHPPPEYENIFGFINDDKRLDRTVFTTF